MKELLECLKAWLQEQQDSNNAREICLALAIESAKRAGSADAQQLLFDVLDLAPATDSGARYSDDHEGAKRWFKRAEPERYLESRRIPLEAHFREHGHHRALQLRKTPSAGKHRTQWYYDAYDLPEAPTGTAEEAAIDAVEPDTALAAATERPLVYEITPPEHIRLNWVGQLLAGRGEFGTFSWRGMLWASLLIFGAVLVAAVGLLFWAMHGVNRPLTTGDLVLLIGLVAAGAVFWWSMVRPMLTLLNDRIVTGGDWLATLSEAPCQLEMTKTLKGRSIRVVRYSGTCPVCSGRIELEYGFGDQRRRLFGCCTEAPREHVFTFDRVTLIGKRVT